MKRLILILILIPSIAFGTYTEFYCQSGGSNLNAGTTTNNTATYTSIHGNWVQSTGIFTPTDGTTPASTVSVGMRASVYIDGASVGVYVGEITAVGAGANGAITANTRPIGAKPSDQTGTATIKVEGAWLGPNAASGFPITLANFGNNNNSSINEVRLNMKNDQTYSLTASITPASGGNQYVIQGYTSSVGDGGKATWDGTTNAGQLLAASGPSGTSFIDLIFKTSISSGTSTLVIAGNQISWWIRCVFTGSRGIGFSMGSSIGTVATEIEAYGNNTSNTSSLPGININGVAMLSRCISHDNTGSNTSGFLIAAGQTTLSNCIADTNGKHGIEISDASVNGGVQILNCDLYNNASDGINVSSTTVTPIWIENCNLIKNAGKGINNASTGVRMWGLAFNNGYGAGTQANGSADTLGGITSTGAVTYGSNLTPWVDGPNGNFSNNLPASQGAGRGAFTETAPSYSGTIGYPDISAAQANIGVSFPTPTPTPTVTPTATPTATPTSTPTPIETSYGYPG